MALWLTVKTLSGFDAAQPFAGMANHAEPLRCGATRGNFARRMEAIREAAMLRHTAKCNVLASFADALLTSGRIDPQAAFVAGLTLPKEYA